MGTISFTNQEVSLQLRDKLLLKSFLMTIFTKEGKKFKSLSYIFCTDQFLLKLNQQYLNHDTFTDILTFALSNSPLPIVAEIYISVDRVKENARDLKIDFLTELKRVMIHGILHLCGYEDYTKADKKIMREKEDHYLQDI